VPVPVNASAQTQAIWTYIYNILAAEINPSGRLSTVADIRKSLHLGWVKKAPSIGVQPLKWSQIGEYGQRRREIEITFLIAAAAFSTVNGNRPPNLDDALASLQPILDAGNGHGIEPIIHDPSNLTLGGYATTTSLHSLVYDWRVIPDADQRTWAYGCYHFNVQTIVTI
jgi:hypothetical protein